MIFFGLFYIDTLERGPQPIVSGPLLGRVSSWRACVRVLRPFSCRRQPQHNLCYDSCWRQPFHNCRASASLGASLGTTLMPALVTPFTERACSRPCSCVCARSYIWVCTHPNVKVSATPFPTRPPTRTPALESKEGIHLLMSFNNCVFPDISNTTMIFDIEKLLSQLIVEYLKF